MPPSLRCFSSGAKVHQPAFGQDLVRSRSRQTQSLTRCNQFPADYIIGRGLLVSGTLSRRGKAYIVGLAKGQ